MAIIYNKGNITLAANITKANGQSPWVKKYITPSRIVSELVFPNEVVRIIGSVLAGMYIMKAAIKNAQARLMLSCLR
jgi:hypothetical protein